MSDTYRHWLWHPLRRTDSTAPPTTPASGPVVPRTASERRLTAAPRARNRRHPVDACQICGRTLLAGEGTREIVSGESVLEACSLCVISTTRDDAARDVA
jgi:hypothetical protein